MDIRKAALHNLAEALKNKEFSSEELCREYLKQIDTRDHEIGAFLEIALSSPRGPKRLPENSISTFADRKFPR